MEHCEEIKIRESVPVLVGGRLHAQPAQQFGVPSLKILDLILVVLLVGVQKFSQTNGGLLDQPPDALTEHCRGVADQSLS